MDPNFLAAHSLRDQILSAPVSPRRAAAGVPPVDGYAQIEQRAKRRRVDRRVEAARTALARGRVKDAAAALAEAAELDPNLPEVKELTAQINALRRTTTRRSHRGRWLVAAAAF